MPDERTTGAGEQGARERVTLRMLLLGTGPRFARDALGPVITFYLVWRVIGLVSGILAATLVSVLAFVWERRRMRTGLAPAIGLTIALVQAAAGLLSGSAKWYFAPAVIVNAAYGVAFLVSVPLGRPLAGVFASETYPFPPEVKSSATFRHVFSRVSLVWAFYLLARSALRLATLTRASVDVFIVVNVLTGLPITAALMTWSVWYGLRGFRRSEEWGPYLR